MPCNYCVYVLSLHYTYMTLIKALTDRIGLGYPISERPTVSFVTLIIQIDVPKSKQIRIIARPIPSDANTHIGGLGQRESSHLFPDKRRYV